MTACRVYTAIREHRPDLLKACAVIVAHNSVTAMAAVLAKHNLAPPSLTQLVRIHEKITARYGAVRDMPEDRRQRFARLLQPLIKRAEIDTIAAIKESKTDEEFPF